MPNVISKLDLEPTGRLGNVRDAPMTMESVLNALSYKFEPQEGIEISGYQPVDKDWLQFAKLLTVPALPLRKRLRLSQKEGDRQGRVNWMEIFFLNDEEDRAIIYPNDVGSDHNTLMLYAEDPSNPDDGPLSVILASLYDYAPGYTECRGLFRKIMHCEQDKSGTCIPRHAGYRCFLRSKIGNPSRALCECTCGNG